AEGALVGGGQHGLAAVPPRGAGQGQFGGAPGAVGGAFEGGIEDLAVVGEALAQRSDEDVQPVAGGVTAEPFERDGRELQDDADGLAPVPGSAGINYDRSGTTFIPANAGNGRKRSLDCRIVAGEMAGCKVGGKSRKRQRWTLSARNRQGTRSRKRRGFARMRP